MDNARPDQSATAAPAAAATTTTGVDMSPHTPVEASQVKYITERRQMPPHYWATLNAPCPLTIETSLDKIKNVPAEEIVAAFEKRACGLLRTASDAFSSISGWSGTAAAHADKQYQKVASPTSRVCSSLLSEMLKPAPPAEHLLSPSTTHGDLVSDHGSASTRSSPPLMASPPKRQSTISFGPAPIRPASTASSARPTPAVSVQPSRQASGCESVAAEHTLPAKRTISFGGVVKTSPNRPLKRDGDRSASDSIDDHDKTPVAPRRITFAMEQRPAPSRNDSTSEASDAWPREAITSDDAAPAVRTRSIKFAAADPPVRVPSRANSTSTSSRRPSLDAHSIAAAAAVSDHDSGRSRSTSHAGSPTLQPVVKPHAPATCKSALDAVLSKEAVGKLPPAVEDDEDDDDENARDVEDEDDEDADDDDDAADRLAIVPEEDDENDDDDDDDDDDLSDFELDSDDDGYVEDVESDDDASVFDEDIFPNMRTSSQTPTNKLRVDVRRASEDRIRPPVTTPVYHPAPPSESDLPDTTDFCAGNLDEDQPACAAFDAACHERAARRRVAKPQDIDPTFPESGSEEDPDDEAEKRLDAAITAAAAKIGANAGVGATTDVSNATVANATVARKICRSPPATAGKTLMRLHSPPLAARRSEHKTRSLPRKHGFSAQHTGAGGAGATGGKHGKFPPKPCRAVMIKQSNEQRAQRRREKKERRHAAREAKKLRKCNSGNVSAAGAAGTGAAAYTGAKAVDTLGHIKMQAIGTKKLTAAKSANPCEFRPINSI